MLKSPDPGRFFETDAEQSKRARRAAKSKNKYGNPVALKSKLVAVLPDPSSASCVFVAESAGSVRRVDVDAGSVKTVYRGPTAPVTCIAIGGPANQTLFAGSWDKCIWSWDIASAAAGKKYAGHADFVKAVACTTIGGKDVLISGGADKKILVWDVATGRRLHSLTDTAQNMLAVQDLVVDPVRDSPDEVCLVSASSDPHIRRWRVRLDGWEQVVEPAPDAPGASERRTILEHETSVYKVVFGHRGEGDEVDLYTSSGDGTSKCLSRLNGFASSDTFAHGDHVRAVAVTDVWVITAGRDEDLKFWVRASGRLYATLEGHYDEVTDLVVLRGGPAGAGPERLCSVSIDGTIRTWPLGKAELDALVKEQEKAAAAAAAGELEVEEKKEETKGGMTAEEEAELAALLEDD